MTDSSGLKSQISTRRLSCRVVGKYVFQWQPLYLIHTVYIQDKVFIPCGIESPGLVAGVAPSMRVGGQVEGAKGVALTSHVFPKEVPGPVNLQVGLEIRFLVQVLAIGITQFRANLWMNMIIHQNPRRNAIESEETRRS